jgi:3-carboxy-cis,cis-muconate cycloisomerase
MTALESFAALVDQARLKGLRVVFDELAGFDFFFRILERGQQVRSLLLVEQGDFCTYGHLEMTTFADHFFTTPAAAAVFSDESTLRHMCRFEIALAKAEGEAGVIPSTAAATIAAALEAYELPTGEEREALFADAAKAGTLAIPFVKRLIAAVRARDVDAASYVHFGATSQDVIDTALMLQLAEAVALIEEDLERLCAAAAQLARTHRETLMLGRTLLQPAIPITFGLKAAQWLVGARESQSRLARLAPEILIPQFGGAAGTLGALGDQGIETARHLARHLPSLNAPQLSLPWHTRRGGLVALACEIGILTGLGGKIARDVSLLMQLEVAEAFEPAEEGRGGSSALPHKRNPVRSMQTLAAAERGPMLVGQLMAGMVQEHERALGAWQAEWSAIPEIFKLVAGALANMAATLEGLEVKPARMRHNLEALQGLPAAESFAAALAPRLGRSEAHELVEKASRAAAAGQGSLADLLAADPRVGAILDRDAIGKLADPANALGSALAFVDAALAACGERSA